MPEVTPSRLALAAQGGKRLGRTEPIAHLGQSHRSAVVAVDLQTIRWFPQRLVALAEALETLTAQARLAEELRVKVLQAAQRRFLLAITPLAAAVALARLVSL